MDDPKIVVSIIAIAVSTALSAIALIRSYMEQKRTNRINIARRLSDVSKVLSEDLTVLARFRTEVKKEIKLYKNNDSPEINKKLKILETRINTINKEQKDIDIKQDIIDEMYKNIEKVDPVELEIIMKNCYSWKVSNESALELLFDIKNER